MRIGGPVIRNHSTSDNASKMAASRSDRERLERHAIPHGQRREHLLPPGMLRRERVEEEPCLHRAPGHQRGHRVGSTMVAAVGSV